MHQQEDIFENRKQFQLERLILFSDAVFAIAITLMVLEIKIPASDWTKPITTQKLNQYLVELLPNIFGFVSSFFIVGYYWTNHHRMFGYITNFDGRVIWLNLLLLFFVAILPFTTNLASEYGYLNEVFFLYYTNVSLIGLISFFIMLHISNPIRNLSIGLEDGEFRRYLLARSLTVSAIFFIGALLCLTNILFLQIGGKFIYVLIFPAIAILRRVFGIKKKEAKTKV